MRVRDALGITTRRQKQLARLMEATLIGIVFIGIYEKQFGLVINAGVGVVVTQLVPLLERDYDVPMDPGLTLWIFAAVTFHAIGAVGWFGGETLYRGVWWWDHLTHALSASVVAGVGYATVRAIDEHADSVSLPPKFIFVFILLFVLAFGVLWEVLEFAIAITADALGTDPILTQYGLTDTLWDLVFDTLGAIVVATWGSAHLNDVSGYLRERMERRAAD
jgi:uncharacterized membrane protein YjdF